MCSDWNLWFRLKSKCKPGVKCSDLLDELKMLASFPACNPKATTIRGQTISSDKVVPPCKKTNSKLLLSAGSRPSHKVDWQV